MHDFLLLTWTCLKIQDSEGNAGQRQAKQSNHKCIAMHCGWMDGACLLAQRYRGSAREGGRGGGRGAQAHSATRSEWGE